MSQLALPSDADIAKQIKDVTAQAKAAHDQIAEKAKALSGQVDAKMKEIKANRRRNSFAQQHPDQAQQAMQQAQGQVSRRSSSLQQEVPAGHGAGPAASLSLQDTSP